MTPALGFVQRFAAGDRAAAEAVITGIAATGIDQLRLPLAPADWQGDAAADWIGWLLPRLAQDLTVLPVLDLAPQPRPARGAAAAGPATGNATGPATGQATGRATGRATAGAAGAVARFLDRHGRALRHLELCPAAGGADDPAERLASAALLAAARAVRRRGVRPVLTVAGARAVERLTLWGERGVLAEVAAVGLDLLAGDGPAPHTLPDAAAIDAARQLLARFNPAADLWLTRVGRSSWRHDEIGQLRGFVAAAEVPVARVYWDGWRDAPATDPGADPRAARFGATSPTGAPKLLARVLTDGGLAAARRMAGLAAPRRHRPARPVVITGGAGFVGANLADALLGEGHEVVVVDTLARPGVALNLDWLIDRHGARLHPALCDIRDGAAMRPLLADAGGLCHLAAQTAVTTSLAEPAGDFDINLCGSFTLLEALRQAGRPVPTVFASTNKVYGALDRLAMIPTPDGHRPADARLARQGVDEGCAIDFRTPYGCSKGAADQYVIDYAGSFGLPATVLRMSCIYGPRQFGTEDQGWVAHFLRAALAGQEITVYGDGLQTRDLLHVTDAVAAWRLALDRAGALRGRAFNLGGGPGNAVSLRRVLAEIGQLTGRPPGVRHAEPRAGDQPWFVADTAALSAATGWAPRIGWRDGLVSLHEWLRDGLPGSDRAADGRPGGDRRATGDRAAGRATGAGERLTA